MTEDTKSDKPSAPQCGLYLRIPEDPNMEEWQPRLLAMNHVIKNDHTYTRNMHVIECAISDNAEKEAVEKLAAFVQIAQLQGLVAIIKGDVKWVEMLDADGVILSDPADITAARKILGEEKIIGLICNNDKDLAESALKQNVDYVTYGNPIAAPPASLISWHTTRTDKPCVTLGPITNGTAALYARAGTTFLDITNYLTTHKKGPMQATVNMLYEIDLASGGVIVN